MDLINSDFESFEKSIPEALDAIAAYKQISKQTAILIKPNLTTDSPHPITTSPECCKVIIDYIRKYSQAKIIIAEGSGDVNRET
ncbi:MAG: DUF362 domain-containing protein, partial [Gammaproteobacteria bacterium]|nr:DUF362 domain-containing protein [Gammaproteobacteria bacterium]